MPESVFLRVAEAIQADVGTGKARIDTATRVKLNISPGDIIEIRGTKTTAAVVWRVLAEDEGKDIIRIDGLVRKNTGTTIGEKVEVLPAEAKPGRKVILAPVISENQRIQFGQGIETFVKRGLMKRPVVVGDNLIVPGIALMGGALPFGVTSTDPKGIVQIVDSTEIEVKEEATKQTETIARTVTYEDIGGLERELQRVREMIELPLKHPELFDRLGIEPPKGVLLHGPPGTGKTLIAKAVANESGAAFFSIQGPEIMSKFYGESEAQLRNKFEEAQKAAPSIIFIDELDSIAPSRENVQGEVERRVVAQLLTLMDGLNNRGKVVVIAATNRVNAIDPALRRPGRFDREIVIGVPDFQGRHVILQIHTRGMPLEDGFSIEEFSRVTHGFVGADLEALCKEAAMKALRRYLPDIDLDEPIGPAILEKMRVTSDDFRAALREIEPSALRDVFIEIPTVRWADIGGLEKVKLQLKESVELPLKRPDVFKRLGIRPPAGILLYGAPGTGKTLLAKAVATESEANFISIKGPEILSKWVGESEKAVREIFKKAKQSAPTIVFLDEIDSIAPRRGMSSDSNVTERVVNQLLTSIDGIESVHDVIVIAATNRPDILDPGLLRSGRFDRLLYIPPPDAGERLKILEVHTRGVPLGEDVNLEELARMLDGYVGADIEGLIRESAMIALREDLEHTIVRRRHINQAIEVIRPSADEETVKYYRAVSKSLEGRLAKQRAPNSDVSYI